MLKTNKPEKTYQLRFNRTPPHTSNPTPPPFSIQRVKNASNKSVIHPEDGQSKKGQCLQDRNYVIITYENKEH